MEETFKRKHSETSVSKFFASSDKNRRLYLCFTSVAVYGQPALFFIPITLDTARSKKTDENRMKEKIKLVKSLILQERSLLQNNGKNKFYLCEVCPKGKRLTAS